MSNREGDGPKETAVDDSGDASIEPDEAGFLYVRLRGRQFDAPGMPAEALVEVAAVRAALFEAARRVWLDDHPGRSNVPGGFDAALDLRLRFIGEGSAEPRLYLNVPQLRDRDDDELLPAFRRAPERLVENLASVRDNHRFPETATPRERRAINRIGRSLPAEDVIDLGTVRPSETNDPETSPALVGLSGAVRRTLRLIDEALSEKPEPELVRREGLVVELDGEHGTFLLKLQGESKPLPCRIARGEFGVARTIKEVLAEDGVTAPDVAVQGWAVATETGRIELLDDVIDVSVVRTFEEKRLVTRLDVLADLEDGWWEASSKAPDPGVLNAIRTALPHVATLPVVPDILARADGTIAFELELGPRSVVAVIEDEGRRMFLFSDDGSTPDPEESLEAFEPQRLASFLGSGRVR